MARAKSRIPTEAELAILRVLWDRGPSTVREVHETLRKRREVGHTTVLKTMQIMTQKGLVETDRSVRPQIFRPAQSKGVVQKKALRDLVDRVFAGSAGNLVLQLLSSRETSREELSEIRQLLDELEGEPAAIPKPQAGAARVPAQSKKKTARTKKRTTKKSKKKDRR